jgi:hypothetical protein
MATVQGIHANIVRLSQQLERARIRCEHWDSVEDPLLQKIRKALFEKRYDMMWSLEEEYKAVRRVVNEYVLYGARKVEQINVERGVLDILVGEEEEN